MGPGKLARSLVAVLAVVSMMFLGAPAASAAEYPVEAEGGLCPVGWYGVWTIVGVQGPTGDIQREVVLCFRA